MQFKNVCSMGQRLIAENRPTKRAADGGDSAPFSSIFHASSFFCSPKLVLTRRPLTQTVRRLKSDTNEKRVENNRRASDRFSNILHNVFRCILFFLLLSRRHSKGRSLRLPASTQRFYGIGLGWHVDWKVLSKY